MHVRRTFHTPEETHASATTFVPGQSFPAKLKARYFDTSKFTLYPIPCVKALLRRTGIFRSDDNSSSLCTLKARNRSGEKARGKGGRKFPSIFCLPFDEEGLSRSRSIAFYLLSLSSIHPSILSFFLPSFFTGVTRPNSFARGRLQKMWLQASAFNAMLPSVFDLAY